MVTEFKFPNSNPVHVGTCAKNGWRHGSLGIVGLCLGLVLFVKRGRRLTLGLENVVELRGCRCWSLLLGRC